jgi:MFS family permease
MSRPARSATAPILAVVTATFACYLAIGIPFATLPGYVHGRLGFGAIVAGLAISVQYVATLLTRPRAGRMTDLVGAKPTVLYGLAACAASGALLVGAALAAAAPWLSLLLLLASRLTLGFGESCVATGAIAWGIGRVGPAQTAQVISWNGIATYGAIAIGAPLGAWVDRLGGFAAAGATTIVIAVAGWLFASTRPPAPVLEGERMPFGRVLSRILPFGLGLALSSIGFGAIAAFITLFYASHHWANATAALTAFGACFVACRLVFVRAIDRYGGYPVAFVSFVVEFAGLALLAGSATPGAALAGTALSGLGFALVFPSLGVEAIAGVPAQSRGAALGGYAAFLDLALGIAGPVMGGLATAYSYAAAFGAVSAAVAGGGILTVTLWWRVRRARGSRQRWWPRALRRLG